ncbi:MAG TPA: hypothetical protein VHM67_09595 [Gemmatimonadaceae bacterium]|nr:hypothetical protein [Gemmatimonadaceae bacterium]
MVEPRRPSRRSIVPSRRLVAELTNDEIEIWLRAQDALDVFVTIVASHAASLASASVRRGSSAVSGGE